MAEGKACSSAGDPGGSGSLNHTFSTRGTGDGADWPRNRGRSRLAPQMVNARRLRSGHLWQNRFFSCPLSTTHLRRVFAYVERNPVRAGLVAEAGQYQWSSAPIHLGLVRDRLQLADVEAWRQQGGAEAWRSLLAAPEEASSVRLLRRCTYAGRPFGDGAFVDSLEARFRRKWRRWGFEGEPCADTS